ncbi:MAG: protoporphyrinogen oxidase [Bryobacteraceae bacterium]
MSPGSNSAGNARVVIVGGGISGLSAAHALGKAGVLSTLFESRPRLGGVIETKRIQDCLVECGPDSFLAAKPQAVALAKELGLGDQIMGSNDEQRITFIRRYGRMVPMPDGLMMMVPTKIMPLIRTPLLGFGTKLRMGLEFFRKPPAVPLPDRSVGDFIRDHYGDEAVDYLAEPLLSGVYGGDPNALSVQSVLARFVDLENKYGSLSRGVLATLPKKTPGAPSTPIFATLRGGLGQIIDALESAIRARTEVRYSTVEALERTGEGWRVRADGAWVDAPHVIIAAPGHAAAHLIRGFDPESAALLDSVGYTSSTTIAIGYRRSEVNGVAKGFGFLVPKKERNQLLAATFVHNKFKHRAPDSTALVRAFLTGTEGSDEDLVATVREELTALIGLRADPLFSSVSRWPRAMAQYTVGHADRQRRLEERIAELPGLYLAGNAQAGIGIPDCIQSGQTAAKRILDSRIP